MENKFILKKQINYFTFLKNNDIVDDKIYFISLKDYLVKKIFDNIQEEMMEDVILNHFIME